MWLLYDDSIVFMLSPMGILQGIYAKYYGVALTTIATVLLIARLFDAVTDPLIGYWSDRVQAKSGTRKPFIVAGGLLFIISSYCLYVPVSPNAVDTSTVVSTPYFLTWFLLFYLAWSLLEIPHLAWAAELAPSSQAKNKIYSLRLLSNHLGKLCFYLVPFLPFFASREFTPYTLQWSAVAAGLLMLFALYLCVTRTPNGPRVYRRRPIKDKSLWALRLEVMANKPLLLFFIAFSLFGCGSGMWYTLIFIVVDSYLKLGHHYALVALIGLVASIVILGVWYWLANQLGKKFVLGASAFLYASGAMITGFLEPGQTDIVTLFLVMLLIYMSAIPAIASSLLAEIIDYNTWKFGTDRSATYFALFTFAAKTAAAIGGSLGLGIAGWYGFDATAAEQTESAVFGLHLAACWLPAVLMLLSIVAFGLIPINTHRHQIIRRRLDARTLRENRQAAPQLENKTPLQTLKPITH